MNDFIANRTDAETTDRIARELDDPDSYASRFIDELALKAKHLHELIDWQWLLEDVTPPTFADRSRDLGGRQRAEPSQEAATSGTLATEWLSAPAVWPVSSDRTIEAWAAILVLTVAHHLATSVVLGRRRSTTSPDATDAARSEEVEPSLAAGIPVTLQHATHWLYIALADDAVVVRAGPSPADRFERFKVQFMRGATVVAEITATAGAARLTIDVFQAAGQASADSFVVRTD